MEKYILSVYSFICISCQIYAQSISTTPDKFIMHSQANSMLGYSVSSAGDVNGDGYTDVLAAAPYYDNGQNNEGIVLLYNGTATGISSTPAWSAEGNFALGSYTSKYGNAIGFGTSVSEAGDVNGDGYGDVIIGSPFFTNGNNGEGKVFVYFGSASGLGNSPGWTYEADTDSTWLGFSVSGAGDVNGDGYSDVIAGAPTFSNGQFKEGRAFLFYGSASGLSSATAVVLEENNERSLFGWCVSSAGDVNSDGYADVIVTSPFYKEEFEEQGKAFVYYGSSSGLSTVANWSHTVYYIKGLYGQSASWAGDVNGDGYGDVIIGADHHSLNCLYGGRVFIFHGSAGGLSSTPTTAINCSIAYEYFGASVSGCGDVNGDGYADVIIGAYGYHGSSMFEGAAYVFYGTPNGLINTLYTMIKSNKSNTCFGSSVCAAGDVNGDGFSDIIAGAYLYDKTTTPMLSNCGAIYLFHGKAEGISRQAIPANTFGLTQPDAGLGNFVTTIGDVNGDGYADIATGASMFDNNGSNTGIVYIFHGSATGFSLVPATTLSGPGTTNAYFGISIGAAGDVNGDGYSDVIVGASGYAGEGSAFIYLGSASGLNLSPHAILDENKPGAELGYSVSGAGDVNGDGYSDVIVGAPKYNGGAVNEGKVFVYFGSSTGVDLVADWSYETEVSEMLGTCVAGIGDANGDGFSDVALISSAWSNGQSNEGRIFFFRGSASGLESSPASILETNIANASLNNQSMNYAGDLNGDGYNDLVVGVSTYSNGQTNEGALITFYGTSPDLDASSIKITESNISNAFLGATVGFCGDVNGDGYQDVISGSPLYSNGQSGEGRSVVYTGSASGLGSLPYYTFETNRASAAGGSSVSTAGDANGDGFADLVIGAAGYDTTTGANAGRIYVFYGNNAHGIMSCSKLTRQYRSDLITPVQTSNSTFESICVFGIGHFEKSYLGRARARLAFEVRGHPDPFSTAGGCLSNCVAYSGCQPVFSNMGMTGTEMKHQVTAPGLGFPKWRTRSAFHILDAIDGQRYGRWFYAGINDKQDRSIKVEISCGMLPVEVLHVGVICHGDGNILEWSLASITEVESFVVLGSTDGENFYPLTTLEPNTGLQYSVVLPDENEVAYVRLDVYDKNSVPVSYMRKTNHCTSMTSLSVYPNPVTNLLYIRLEDNGLEIDEVSIVDMNGKLTGQYRQIGTSLDVSSLETGVYHIIVSTTNGKKFSARFNRL